MNEKELKIKAKMALDRKKKLKEWSEDFTSFASENIKIIGKDASDGLLSFHQNEAQQYITSKLDEQLAKTGKVRAIILKARQQGMSTYCTSRVFWKTYFTPYSRSVVIAHDSATSDALFNMSKNLIDNMDSEFAPKEIRSNAKEIIINSPWMEGNTTAAYRLYTAGSPEAGRGTTPTILHASEVAFWQHDEKILSGLFQGISQAAGTEVILESTANGAEGEFYRLWQTAVDGYEDGNSEYMPIFVPWFITSEYQREAPEDFTLTQEESDYKDKYDLTDNQMYWRRLKIAEGGSAKFQQEYPACAEEAFLTSGAHVFDMEKLNAIVPAKPEACRVFNNISKDFTDDPYMRGELDIWQFPNWDDKFVMAADVSMGIGQDYATAVVLNQRQEVCALYRNAHIDPDSFGDLLFYLGRYYNNCLLAVENNNMGQTTTNRLEKMKYSNLYYRIRKTTTGTAESLEAGWKTTGSSKPQIIGHLKRAIENGDVGIPSKVMIRELKDYVMTDNGKTEAVKGSHDDTVMALAIAMEVMRTHGHTLANKGFSEYSWVNDQANETAWL